MRKSNWFNAAVLLSALWCGFWLGTLLLVESNHPTHCGRQYSYDGPVIAWQKYEQAKRDLDRRTCEFHKQFCLAMLVLPLGLFWSIVRVVSYAVKDFREKKAGRWMELYRKTRRL